MVISQQKNMKTVVFYFLRFIQQNNRFGENIHYLGGFQSRQDVIKLKC